MAPARGPWAAVAAPPGPVAALRLRPFCCLWRPARGAFVPRPCPRAFSRLRRCGGFARAAPPRGGAPRPPPPASGRWVPPACARAVAGPSAAPRRSGGRPCRAAGFRWSPLPCCGLPLRPLACRAAAPGPGSASPRVRWPLRGAARAFPVAWPLRAPLGGARFPRFAPFGPRGSLPRGRLGARCAPFWRLRRPRGFLGACLRLVRDFITSHPPVKARGP